MRAQRTVALLGIALLCGFPLFGCAPKNDAVDAPLNTNAGPPPPRPNKPEISPSGQGGGAASGTAAGTSNATK